MIYSMEGNLHRKKGHVGREEYEKEILPGSLKPCQVE